MQDPSSGPGELADEPEGLEDAVDRRRIIFSPLTFLFGFGAGAFIGVALAIAAFTLADDSPVAPQASAAIQEDVPLLVTSGTVQPTPDARPKSKAALDVRLGPGNGYAVVGLLAKGESVEVIGRDNDSQWLAIRFPPGSAAQGWIPVAGVDEPPELASLTVALPTPLPRTISTFPAGAFPAQDQEGAGASTVATRTPNPLAGTPTFAPGKPDLVITKVSILPNRHVSVTVTNRGPGDLVGFTVFVQVRDLGAKSEVISAPLPSLRVGQTVTLETSTFEIVGEQTIQAIVDPFGSIAEADRSNNTTQVVLAAPVTPTNTPPPPTGP